MSRRALITRTTARKNAPEAMQRVAETRQALRRGITDDEYVSVVRIPQRMASNLESPDVELKRSGSDPRQIDLGRCNMSPTRATTHPNEAAFPVGLSGPALRALAHAGIGSMAQLARRSEAELRALHGMGPKALRILKSALADQSRHFREDRRPQRRSG